MPLKGELQNETDSALIRDDGDYTMNGWFQFTEATPNTVTRLFFEVSEDRIVRQVERYGDCWVYSGDPESFCIDGEGIRTFGNRGETAFSSLLDLEPRPYSGSTSIGLEEGWRTIDAALFETAWQTACRLAVHLPDRGSQEQRSQSARTIEPVTNEQRKTLVESMQGVIDTCKRGLERPATSAENRSYLAELIVKTEAQLESQRRSPSNPHAD